MTANELKDHPVIAELRALQEKLALPDSDFARRLKFEYSASSWGRIRSGTYHGNLDKALRYSREALQRYQVGGGHLPEARNGVVFFPHILDALDAVAVARVAKDEHRLAVVTGEPGAGKTVTLKALSGEHTNSLYMESLPSWAQSYLRGLRGLARGLGLAGTLRSCGEAEDAILNHLTAAPGLILIDEFNHFSKDLINFLKTIINQTRSAMAVATLPHHLARMTSQHNEEARQFLRRAVAIIHIGRVTTETVLGLAAAVAPDLALGNRAIAIANAANRMKRLDTVKVILDEIDGEGETAIDDAIRRIERSQRAVATAQNDNG